MRQRARLRRALRHLAVTRQGGRTHLVNTCIAALRHTCALPACLVVSLLAAGCATERVVLLPGPDGTVGKVVVMKGLGKHTDGAVIDTAYSDAKLGAFGAVEQAAMAEAEIAAQFGSVLAALPAAPTGYLLYFLDDSDEMTEESKAIAVSVLTAIASTPFAEVVVIGHTDLVGDMAYNDQLSLSRAQVTALAMVEIGVPRERIRIEGRGEREPMIQTQDNRREPRNRRVEISVR